jgi:hypothetical protein
VPQVYVYGVAPSERCWRPDGDEGVHGAPLRVLEHGPLAALVSDVEAEVVGRRRELRAHTAVLEEALDRSPVLPARFGTVAPDEDAVLDQLLRERQDELLRVLAAIDGLVEVRLSGSYDEDAVLQEVLRRHPALAGPPPSSIQARMDRGRRVVEGIDEQRRLDEQAVLEHLTPLAEEVRADPPRGELGAFALSFLVPRSDLDAFDAAVRAATAPLEARARLRYVGPLPPASFVAVDVGARWGS